MNTPVNDIDKIKFTNMAGWLITLLIVIMGYNYLKEIIVFVLTKLYEYFIQHTVLKIG